MTSQTKSTMQSLIAVVVILLILGVPIFSFAQITPAGCPEGFQPDQSGFCVPSPTTGAGARGVTTPSRLILTAINVLLALAGVIAVLFLVIGGLRYLSARGNEEAAEAAKKTLLNAVIGIVIVILAFAIIRVISNVLIFRSV
jgi:hypothetical protein